MVPYVYPWFLHKGVFGIKKNTVTDEEMAHEIHRLAREKIKEEGLTGEQLKYFIDKINELYSNKIGEAWKELKIEE